MEEGEGGDVVGFVVSELKYLKVNMLEPVKVNINRVAAHFFKSFKRLFKT